VEPHQLDLFSQTALTPSPKQKQLAMNKDELVRWKQQIFEYQQRIRETSAPHQGTLFDIAPKHCNPEQIDPLKLRLQPMSFYRMPTDSPGDCAIYFILDNALPLILYIGETSRSNRRWKGVHGCKDYIDSYQDLHYRYGLQTAVNIAFWWDAPTDRKARQELELSLILRWQSPFNKQMWERWACPFG
jgi:hypothetical protein